MKHFISDEELMDFLDGRLDRESAVDLRRRVRENGQPELLHHLRLAQKALLDQLDDEEPLTDSLRGRAVTVAIAARPAAPRRLLALDPKRLAAAKRDGYLCDIECEEYILLALGLQTDRKSLLDLAYRNRWMREKGMPIYHIGRLLEKYHLSVARRYASAVGELEGLLAAGCHVIAVVNADRLTAAAPLSEANPNHAVVVLSVDSREGAVELFDPQTGNSSDRYPLGDFSRAWSDSQHFLVAASRQGTFAYDPQPISVDDVPVSPELAELGEAIAENAHEIWASKRRGEGWSYGPVRDDTRLETPDMVPYSDLPEAEKDYDRAMALQTLRLVRKLGYRIVRDEQ